MGVIYKLKPEVVEAIVQRKKDNPKMGCRKIADEISAEFDVKVSKSSVNTVLKESHLSSSVGRRSNTENPKNFTIPAEKKKQLKDNVYSVGLTEKLIKSNRKERPKGLAEEPSILDVPSAVEKTIQKGIGQQKNELEEELPSVTEQKNTDESILSEKIESDGKWSSKQDGMGQIIKLMIHRELGGAKILIGAVERLRGAECSKNEQEALQIWFDFWTFGIMTIDQMKKNNNHIVWAQYKEEFEQQEACLDVLSNIIDDLKKRPVGEEMAADFIQHIELAKTLVGGFEVKFISGKTIFLDGKASQMAGEKVEPVYGVFLECALETLSKALISGQHSISMFSIPFDDNSLELFYFWIKFLNGSITDKVSSIHILNNSGEVIGCYDMFVHCKREFFVGLYPGDADYEHLVKMDKWAPKEEVYDICSSEQFLVSEMAAHFPDQSILDEEPGLRVVSVSQKEAEGAQFAILTNNCDEDIKILMRRFFNKFSLAKIKKRCLQNKNKEGSKETKKSIKNLPISFLDQFSGEGHILDLFDLLKLYFDQIEQVVKQYIEAHEGECDVTNLLSYIYGISGRYQRHENHIFIDIQASSGQKEQTIFKSVSENFSNYSFLFRAF